MPPLDCLIIVGDLPGKGRAPCGSRGQHDLAREALVTPASDMHPNATSGRNGATIIEINKLGLFGTSRVNMVMVRSHWEHREAVRTQRLDVYRIVT